MKIRFGHTALMLGFGATIAVLPFPRVLAARQTGFTGTWERNEDESDDPEEKMRAAFEAMRERMKGRGGRMGPPPEGAGRPGGMGEAGRMGPGGRPGAGPPDFGSMFVSADSLETTLKGGEFHVLTSDDAPVRIYYLDGKKHKRQAPSGMTMETKSEMTGDRIVVEQETEQGGEIRETYELSPDGGRMIVTVQFKGRFFKEPVIVRTVYEAVPDETEF